MRILTLINTLRSYNETMLNLLAKEIAILNLHISVLQVHPLKILECIVGVFYRGNSRNFNKLFCI